MHPLFSGEDRHAWHRFRTPDIPALAGKGTLCLLPVVTLCERGEDVALDAEERVVTPLLGSALETAEKHVSGLVLPPVRHLPRLMEGQVFPVNPATATAYLHSVVASAVRAGFDRFVFLHVADALSEWLDAEGRDLRTGLGVKVYRVGLHALGVSPLESPSSEAVDALADLLGEISSHAEGRS